jgi:hypothetical protein
MAIVRKVLSSALIWLTAGSSLVAGTPLLSCRCPDGRLKLVCFKAACCALPSESEPGACCCCQARTAGQPAHSSRPARSCCQQHGAQTTATSIQQTGCTRTLTEVAPSVVVHDFVQPLQDPLPTLDVVPVTVGPDGALGFRADLDHHRPPPDLTITLLHLVI